MADRGNRRISNHRRDGKVKFVFDTVDPPCAIASDATFMIVVMSTRRTIEVYRKRGKLQHRYVSLSSFFAFVRGEVLPATSSSPHLIVFSTHLCLLSSSSSLPPLMPSSHLS